MIKAVAFDIDGTLYCEYSLFYRCIPFALKHLRFMIAFSQVRKEIRALHQTESSSAEKNFFDLQAELMSEKLSVPAEKIKSFIDKEIYHGWQSIFAKIPVYKNALPCIAELKERGYKIGILSDFPPEQKNDIWGIAPLCDAIVGSEYCNALKPQPHPFLVLAEKLNVAPEEMLYIGNSYRYDVLGAKNANIRTGYICSGFKKIFSKHKADIVFSSYKQLVPLVEALNESYRNR